LFKKIQEAHENRKLNIGPITTQEHPNPSEIRRYIDDEDGFYGFDCVFLEEATWNALYDTARERDASSTIHPSTSALNFRTRT
jgi:hypothetical protein